jgi:hypothetical protein
MGNNMCINREGVHTARLSDIIPITYVGRYVLVALLPETGELIRVEKIPNLKG